MSNAHGIGASLAESAQEPLLTQFLRLIPNRGNSSVKRVGSVSWRQMSQFHYLTDEEIDSCIETDSVYIRAVSLEENTSYLVISIPEGSRYLLPEQFARLNSLLESLSLAPKCYREGDSEAVQIYLPFTEKADTDSLHRVVVRELVNQSFEIAAHSLIVHAADEPFALPLQAGFAWLNSNLSVKLLRKDISRDSAIALFISDLQRAAVSPLVLLERPIAPTPLNIQALIEVTIDLDSVELESSNITPCDTVSFNAPDVVPLAFEAEEVKSKDLEASPETASERFSFEPPQRTADEHSIVSTQLHLFAMSAPQPNVEELIPIKRRRRPRSDPQAPRAEPDYSTPKLFTDSHMSELRSPDHQKEVIQRD